MSAWHCARCETAIGAAAGVAGAPSASACAGCWSGTRRPARRRVIVRMKVSSAVNCIDRIERPCVRCDRGHIARSFEDAAVRIARLKKSSRAEALLPRRTWIKRNFCVSSETAAALRRLILQDLDRVADGAGDCLALRPHAFNAIRSRLTCHGSNSAGKLLKSMLFCLQCTIKPGDTHQSRRNS